MKRILNELSFSLSYSIALISSLCLLNRQPFAICFVSGYLPEPFDPTMSGLHSCLISLAAVTAILTIGANAVPTSHGPRDVAQTVFSRLETNFVDCSDDEKSRLQTGFADAAALGNIALGMDQSSTA